MKLKLLILALLMCCLPGCAQTFGSGVSLGSGTTIGGPATDLPTPPSTAKHWADLQLTSGNEGNWFLCTSDATQCAGPTEPGSATFGLNVVSPSFTGAGMTLTSNGDLFNVLMYRHLGCAVPPNGGSNTTGTLSLTVPVPSTTVDSISFTASASDSGHNVTAIQIYQDNVLVFNSATTAPITPIAYTAAGLNGSHAFVLQAFDDFGYITKVGVNISFGPDCSAPVTNALDDMWFYIPSSTVQLQALEFDPDLFWNSYEYFLSEQCDSVSGHWRFWSMRDFTWTDKDQNGNVIPTYDCSALLHETDQWHHFQLYGKFDTANRVYYYETFVVDGKTVYKNLHQPFPPAPYQYGNGLNVETQIDNAVCSSSTCPATNTMFYDNWNFWFWPD